MRTADMNTLDALDADSLRDDIPTFRPGDSVKVHVRVVEGNRSRIQVFQGVVIRRQGGGIRETDRKSTRLNSSHANISYAVFCLKKKQQLPRPNLTTLFDLTLALFIA